MDLHLIWQMGTVRCNGWAEYVWHPQLSRHFLSTNDTVRACLKKGRVVWWLLRCELTHIRKRREKRENLKTNWGRKINSAQADLFLRKPSCGTRTGDPNILVRKIMRISNSELSAVTGLEIWGHMTHQVAGSANNQKTKTVLLLKQIMNPVEWRVNKSKDVLQL